MKFNNALALLSSAAACCLLLACSSNPDKAQPPLSSVTSATENSSANLTGNIPASVLPAGPVTANPYLQSKPSVAAATESSFRDATLAIQQKNWAQAETLLQSLALTNPKLSGVQLNLGIVYKARGDLDKASEAFSQAIKLNGKNLDAYNQLAVLKRESGKFTEAEALYQQALRVWPFHPESHKNLAILYELYLGKPNQALPHYLAYRQLLPAPDKQVDSWIADLQRRLNAGKSTDKKTAPDASVASEKNTSPSEEK